MKNVKESDHLFVLADKFEYGDVQARGAINMEGGKF